MKKTGRRRLRIAVVTAVLFLLAAAVLIRPDKSVEALKAEYTDHRSRFLTLNGMPVHYRDEGAGPLLLLLHGTSSSLHTWEGWTQRLKKKFRVIRMDLPGFGLTGPHSRHDYRIKTYVAFLDALAVELGADRFSLAGNSLGGTIAWQYALTYPGKVDRLILVAPGGYPDDREKPLVFKLGRTPVLNKVLAFVLPRGLIASSLKEVYADDSKVTPGLIKRYYDLALRPGNREAFIARTRVEHENRFGDIGGISAGTLIMWGEQDLWIPVAHARFFNAAIKNSRLIVYKNIGHVPMEEQPEMTAADAVRFLTAG